MNFRDKWRPPSFLHSTLSLYIQCPRRSILLDPPRPFVDVGPWRLPAQRDRNRWSFYYAAPLLSSAMRALARHHITPYDETILRPRLMMAHNRSFSHSTVTLLARFLGLSTSHPSATAMW